MALVVFLPAPLLAASCRIPTHSGSVTLEQDEADPEIWEEACPTLVRFLSLPPPPWSAALAQRSAAALRQMDYFRNATCSIESNSANANDLRCSLQPKFIVTDSAVLGDLPLALPRDDIKHRLFLRPGAGVPSLPPAVQRQKSRLLAYFASEGYPDAKIEVEAHTEPCKLLQQGVRITVHIDAGAALEIRQVNLQGDIPIDAATLRDAFVHPIFFKWGRHRFRRAQLDDDVADVTTLLQEKGWPAGRVQARMRRLDSSAAEISQCDIDVTVDSGPQVVQEFTGNKALSTSTLEDLATFRKAGAVDALEIENTRSAMLAKYQEDGFDSAHIQMQVDRDDRQRTHVLWSVDEGPRRHLGAVTFRGNSLPEAQLVEGAEMLLRPSGAVFRQHWVDAYVAHDTQALMAYYRHQGFPSAQVEITRQPRGDGSSIEAWVTVQEGPRERVCSVHVQGLPSDLPWSSVRTRLEQHDGAPFEAAALESDADVLRASLAGMGYLHAVVTSQTSRDTRDGITEVSVTQQVVPGPQAVQAGLMISGNLRTLPSTFEAEFSTHDGAHLDVTEIGTAQKRLGALRIFNSVQLRPLTANPNDANTWIFASVQEQPSRTLDAVLSYSTDDDFGVGADFRDRNLFGRALALDATVRLGNTFELINPHLRIGNVDRLQVKLRAPHPFGIPIDAEATVLLENQDPALFFYRHVGGTGTLTRTLLERDTCKHCPSIVARLGYELVEAEYRQKEDTPNSLLPPGAPTNLPSATIGRLIPGFTVDGRDQPLDPRRGYALDVRFDIAHPALAGPLVKRAVAFWRFIGGLQGYLTLATPRLARLDTDHWLGGPLVLALSSQYSAAGPWTAHGSVPLSETFAYGGDFSVRGLASKASSVTLLAHTMLVGSAELRWYLLDLWIGTLALAGFVDVGTVAPGPRRLFQQTTVSVGPVLRYVTPVGPLSLAYGIAVVRPPELALFPAALPPHGRVHFSFGASF